MGLKQTLDISLVPRDRCKKSKTKKKVSELGRISLKDSISIINFNLSLERFCIQSKLKQINEHNQQRRRHSRRF